MLSVFQAIRRMPKNTAACEPNSSAWLNIIKKAALTDGLLSRRNTGFFLVLRLVAVFERYRHVKYQVARFGVLGVSTEVTGP